MHEYDYTVEDFGDGSWQERWYCPDCGREVVYESRSETWNTLCKGDQYVIHTGSVGGLQLDGTVSNNTVPPQFEEFIQNL